MQINRMIDHTLLKPEATREQIKKICDEALEYNFKSVCVNPYWVNFASEILKGSEVSVCTVIGFPLGANTSLLKSFETEEAVKNGASEIDMVLNVGLLKSKEYDLVEEDIKAVVKSAKGKLVKVILETCLLSDEEIIKACELSMEAGVDFVKTSTGFNSEGATTHAVKIMRETVGDKLGVKASGGIRDLKKSMDMIDSGASRLGVSAGIDIIKEYNNAN